MKTCTMLVLLTLWFFGQSSVLAQMPISGQSQADILRLLSELPPETMKKVEQLGKILQQDLKEGKLTEAQIHEELTAGNLEQKLRDLNPETGPLLDDLAQAMKNHPNADNLPNLLNGLVGTGR
jgi:predicted component of type VI protein secretion system